MCLSTMMALLAGSHRPSTKATARSMLLGFLTVLPFLSVMNSLTLYFCRRANVWNKFGCGVIRQLCRYDPVTGRKYYSGSRQRRQTNGISYARNGLVLLLQVSSIALLVNSIKSRFRPLLSDQMNGIYSIWQVADILKFIQVAVALKNT